MKLIVSLAAVLLGIFMGIVGLSFAGKPSNAPLSLDPMDALSTYFFSFGWVGGTPGIIIGAALLLGYVAVWFYVGIWIYKTLVERSA